MVVTDRPLDFSTLVGFQNVVHWGVRDGVFTPKAELVTWDEWLKRCREQIAAFTPRKTQDKEERLTSLPWGEKEWKLFRALSKNLREPATPLLRKLRLRYEDYSEWIKTLGEYCSIHTRFYPQRYENYGTYCFLFFTDRRDAVKSLFSSLPATPTIMEVGAGLLVSVNVISSCFARNLFSTVYDMKVKGMIKSFNQACIISQTNEL